MKSAVLPAGYQSYGAIRAHYRVLVIVLGAGEENMNKRGPCP